MKRIFILLLVIFTICVNPIKAGDKFYNMSFNSCKDVCSFLERRSKDVGIIANAQKMLQQCKANISLIQKKGNTYICGYGEDIQSDLFINVIEIKTDKNKKITSFGMTYVNLSEYLKKQPFNYL